MPSEVPRTGLRDLPLSSAGSIASASIVAVGSSMSGFAVPHCLQCVFLSNCTSLHSAFGQIQSPLLKTCLLLATGGRTVPHKRQLVFRSNWMSLQFGLGHVQS